MFDGKPYILLIIGYVFAAFKKEMLCCTDASEDGLLTQ